MSEQKLIIEVGIDDDAVNGIVDLEREILAQDICGHAARKYLDSLQDDMAQQAKMRKGSKKIHIKTPHFEFDFHAKRALDGMGEKRSWYLIYTIEIKLCSIPYTIPHGSTSAQ